jgi:hypothetical protein
MHATAIDKDPTAAHMCFVQLALLGIPAVVFVGDTLRMEMVRSYATPGHHLGFWNNKIRRGYALGSPADPDRLVVPACVQCEAGDHAACPRGDGRQCGCTTGHVMPLVTSAETFDPIAPPIPPEPVPVEVAPLPEPPKVRQLTMF